MKQIKSATINQARLSMHCAFHQEVIRLMEVATPAALHIEGDFAEYKLLVTDEQLISNRQTTYTSTKDIHAADQLRDSMAGVVMSVVNAHKTSTIPAKAAAAQKLAAILAPFKGIGKRQYVEQTTDVKSMLDALRQDVPMGWVSTLHLEDELDQLETHNNAVAAHTQAKHEENTARARQTDLDTPELRLRIDEKYAKCVQIINAFAIAIPSEAIDTFISAVNGVIDTYRSLMDRNSTSTPTVDPTPGTPAQDGEAPGTEPGQDGGENAGTDPTPPSGGGENTGGTEPGQGGGDNTGGDTPTPPPGGGGDDWGGFS